MDRGVQGSFSSSSRVVGAGVHSLMTPELSSVSGGRVSTRDREGRLVAVVPGVVSVAMKKYPDKQ